MTDGWYHVVLFALGGMAALFMRWIIVGEL
jgi:hypothetical protein